MTSNKPEKAHSHSYHTYSSKKVYDNGKNSRNINGNASENGKDSNFDEGYENFRFKSDRNGREPVDFFKQAQLRNQNKKPRDEQRNYDNRPYSKQKAGNDQTKVQRLLLDLKWERQRSARLQSTVDNSVPLNEYDRVVGLYEEEKNKVKNLENLEGKDFISKADHDQAIDQIEAQYRETKAELEKSHLEETNLLKTKLEEAKKAQRDKNDQNSLKKCADRILKAQATFNASTTRIYQEELINTGIYKLEDFKNIRAVGKTSLDIGSDKRVMIGDLLEWGNNNEKKIKMVDGNGLDL